MRIDDIDALLATVQFSSLNQAAEYLGITQSAITRRLQRLEQELNVTLLEAPDPPADPDRRRTPGVRAVSEH
ncbi:LysR family transcriptional regulator [Klebsiella pneumoniae]